MVKRKLTSKNLKIRFRFGLSPATFNEQYQRSEGWGESSPTDFAGQLNSLDRVAAVQRLETRGDYLSHLRPCSGKLLRGRREK